MRDLMDMCDFLGYLVKNTCRTKGDTVIVELHLQLKDDLMNYLNFSNGVYCSKV